MPEETVVSRPAPQSAPQTDFEKWSKLPEEERNVAAVEEPAAPAAAAEPDDEPAPDSDPDKDVPTGLKKRFRELTTKIRNLEGEVAAAKAPKPAAAPAKVEPAVAAPQGAPKPKLEDCASYEEFTEKLGEWIVDQRELKRAQTAETERANAADRARGIAWQKELKAARARHADYDAVALSDMPINRATHDAIVEGGEDGAELAYYLGNNKDAAAEIFKLSDTATKLALGKILAKLESGNGTARLSVSRAPKPPQTVGGGADVSDKEPDLSDFPKWQAWKRRKEAREQDE